MNNGICHLTVIPMRAEPSHRSEMVSQLLFGETYQVLEMSDEWVRIKTLHDGYEGWIQRKQYFELSDESLDKYVKSSKMRLAVSYLATETYVPNILTMGALMVTSPEMSPFKEPFLVPKLSEEWLMVAGMADMSSEQRMAFIQKAAYSLFGAPYLWGGRTPLGIDCSGFTQLLYSLVGIQLPRDASQQVFKGDTVDFVHEARLGDLAFFHNEEGQVVHVGLMLNNQEIIHSSGSVRIDRVDETGIFNVGNQRYTHQLRVIRRMLP